jgi:hypothetical protein
MYKKLKKLASGKKPPGTKFADVEILAVYLWAVLNDRPVSWAVNKMNWSTYWRSKMRIADDSTVSRRMKTASVQELFENLEDDFKQVFPPSVCRFIDAKPLPIGPCSKDFDAGFGRAASAFAKGYKFYAISDLKQGFVVWDIRPMQKSEGVVAVDLIKKLDSEGYVVGDTAYDQNKVFDAGIEKDINVIAIKRKGGIGHRRQSPGRLKSIELLKTEFGKNMIAARRCIEQMFGQLTNISCGLKPLPNWVRTLRRVKNWVRGKLIFNQIWRIIRQT